MSPADITYARTLLRMTRDLKARVVADAERQNLSESEWWRRAGEEKLGLAPLPAERAAVATSEGGKSASSPVPEKGASLAPAPPRARTSAASKAGIRPRPKGKS